MWKTMLERVVGLIKPSFSSPTLQHGQLPVVRSTSTVTIKMTVYNIFATVLLAAVIFSLTAARGHSLSRPEFAPAELDAASRSPDFYVPILDPETYVHLSREQCGERNGASVYDEVEASLKNFRINVESLVAPLRRKTELALAHPRDRLPSVMRKYCRKVPTLQKYIKHVTHAINACLGRDGVQRVVSGRLFANALLNYICEDGGSGLATFIADGGMECLASKKQELLNCANRNFGSYLAGAEFVGNGVSEVKGFEMLFSLDTKRCYDVRAFQRCMTEALDDCEKPTTAKALNDLFDDLVIRLTLCDPSMSFAEVEREFYTTTRVGSSADEDFESFMMEKCEKSGGGRFTFNSVGESLKMLGPSSQLFDFHRLVDAIEYEYIARPSNSDFDVTIAFYCRKVPIAIEIVKFITDTVKSCLDPEELGMEILHNVTSSLLEAVCYNEGNAIAAFVAGDGPKCMDSKYRELRSCAREIFGGYFEAGGWKKRATPETPFVIDFKDCNDMEKLRICVGKALAECDDRTVSYTLDSVFDTIHHGIWCGKIHGTNLRTEWSGTEFLTDRARQYLKDNCEKHAGPLAYEAVKEIPEYVASGFALVSVNVEQLQADVTEAQIHGQVDLVSKKYCRKIPALKKFIKHATESVAPCFRQAPDEQSDIDFQSGLVLSILDFMCDNGGERFTKLITSGGLECIRSKRSALQQCIPDQYQGDIEGLVKLRKDLNVEECKATNETQHCFVDVLIECRDPTAAETVDDLINLLIKNTNCGPQVDPSG